MAAVWIPGRAENDVGLKYLIERDSCRASPKSNSGRLPFAADSDKKAFIDEQLEEVVKMDRLVNVIRQSGEKNLLMVEAYLVHIEKAG